MSLDMRDHHVHEESALLPKGPQQLKYVTRSVAVLASASLLAAFDTTVVATIRPSIGMDFEALNRTSHLATAYMLSSTVFQPLYGSLSDRYGTRMCLLTAYFAFFLGTLVCAIAPTLSWCICGRGIQGIGGGGMSIMSLVMLSELVPLRQRGLYQGILNTMWGIGSSLGPTIGELSSADDPDQLTL